MDSLDSCADDPSPRPCFLACDQQDHRLSLIEFEQRLHLLCARTDEDDVFWAEVARDVTALETGMNASGIYQCEAAVDYLLSRLGLPAWTIIKGRRDAR